MPFTISHVAAVLPFRHKSLQVFPFAPLAIGSMIPDLPYFLKISIPPDHHWSDILPYYLPYGLVFSLLWYLLLRQPFHALYPYLFPQKNPLLRHTGVLSYLNCLFFIAASVVIGSITHLFLDAFTHGDDRAFILKDVLAASIPIGHLNMPLYRVLQYSLSAAGLLLLLLYAFVQYKNYKQANTDYILYIPPLYRWLLVGVFLSAGLYLGWQNFNILSPLYLHHDRYFLLGQTFVGAIQGTVMCFIFYAMIWQIFRAWHTEH